MNWSPYVEYKTSGAEWLGDVPSHWQVHRLKWSVKSSQNGIWGDEPDGGPDDIRCVRVADFDRPKLRIQDRDVTYRKVRPQERRGRLLTNGDLILEKSGGGEKNPVGFVVLYDRDDPAVTSNFLARISLHPTMEPRYWTYLHSSLYKSRLTQPSIKQTSGIQNLDQQSYFHEHVCFPPSEEQQAIAEWLDSETAKIDALIVKQEELIATLREDRAATITHAVSKGLDAEVGMKESGVEWLGEMPRHWLASRLKNVILSTESGTSVNAGDWPAEADDVGVLKTSCVSTGRFNPKANKTVVDRAEIERATCPVKADSLIVNRANTPLLVGSAGYAEVGHDNLFLSDKLWQVRFKGTLTRFIYYWTQTQVYRSQIAALCVGASSSMQNLAMTDFRNVAVALPPLNEQAAIVSFLSTRTSTIDDLIEKSGRVIRVLREYRATLITDAVTGKIDVRGAEA